MLNKTRTQIINFINNPKNIPWLFGVSAGLYPLLKYYNSNFPLVNSFGHFVVFISLFLVAPILSSYFIELIIGKVQVLKKHETFLFSLVNYTFFILLAIISTWGLEKKILIIGSATAVILAFGLKKHLKKAIVFQLLMALLVVPKILPDIYNQFFATYNWTNLPDNILSVQLKEKPNIYFIQPDGYVSENTLRNQLYNSSSDLYDWLENNQFEVYDNFRSNYPSSLVSNASVFTMKHHYFGEVFSPSSEMPRARAIINGNNSVIEILKNNGYENYFVVEDEYFQQNFSDNSYEYKNISEKDIPYFSSGQNVIRDVFKDLDSILEDGFNNKSPKFFFIEKVLPHHVHFKASVKDEHQGYLSKLQQANAEVKKMVKLISEKDSNSMIIIAADHGGWVGIENYDEFYTTKEPLHINSIFSTLCAIKWNGIENSKYDAQLKSNVNLFRVLFAALSTDSSYLEHLENDGSYHLRKESWLGKSVYKVIDEKGNVVSEKLKK